jgi:hypothetical protein
MKLKTKLRVVSILGVKHGEFEYEADTIEEIKELMKLADGVSIS